MRQAHRLEKVPTFGASLPHVGQANDLPRPGLRCVCVCARASGNGVYDGIRYNGLKKCMFLFLEIRFLEYDFD